MNIKSESSLPKNSTLVIMNYGTASIEFISLTPSMYEEYADDYDRLVYDVMGYKQEYVYYMIADDITVIDHRK